MVLAKNGFLVKKTVFWPSRRPVNVHSSESCRKISSMCDVNVLSFIFSVSVSSWNIFQVSRKFMWRRGFLQLMSGIWVKYTAWKVSKNRFFSGPNTGKYGPEKTPDLDTFHAVVWYCIFAFFLNLVVSALWIYVLVNEAITLFKHWW